MGFERQFLDVIEGAEEVEAGAEFDFIDGGGEIGEILGEAGCITDHCGGLEVINRRPWACVNWQVV